MATELFSALTSRGTVLGTELNALANGSYTAVGTLVDNGSNLDRFGVLTCAVDFVSAPTDRSAVDVFMIPAPDGTNYVDGSASVRPSSRNWLASFEMLATTAAQVLLSNRFELLPCKFKLIAYNRSGQAFPASGSVITLYTFNRTL